MEDAVHGMPLGFSTKPSRLSRYNMSCLHRLSGDASPLLLLLVPDKGKCIKRIINNRGLRTFLVVDHTTNLRKNSKVSAI